MKDIYIYAKFFDKADLEEIGIAKSPYEVAEIIRQYTDKEGIEYTQLMTRVGTKGLNTHALKDNFDIMFVSSEGGELDDPYFTID